MYRPSDLAAKQVRSETHKDLMGRAFDRVITSQLAKFKKDKAPSQALQSEEEFKAAQERDRERAAKKGSRKMSARALELSKQGLSGAVIQMMLEEEGERMEETDSDGGSDTESGSGRDRKKRKKEKKSKKSSKKSSKKISKKDKKDKKSKKGKKEKKDKKEKKSKKRRRDEDSDSEESSESGNADGGENGGGEEQGRGGEETVERARTRSMDAEEDPEKAVSK